MKRYFFVALIIILVGATSGWGGQEEIIYLDNPTEIILDDSIEVKIIKAKLSSILFKVKIKVTNLSDATYKTIKMDCILYDKNEEIISTEDGYILDAPLTPGDYQFHEFLFYITKRMADLESIAFKVGFYKEVFND